MYSILIVHSFLCLSTSLVVIVFEYVRHDDHNHPLHSTVVVYKYPPIHVLVVKIMMPSNDALLV